MGWRDWADFPFLQTVVKHTGNVLAVLLGLQLVHVVAELTLPEGIMLTLVVTIDNFLIAVLFLFLAYRLVVELWNAAPKSTSGFLAA